MSTEKLSVKVESEQGEYKQIGYVKATSFPQFLYPTRKDYSWPDYTQPFTFMSNFSPLVDYHSNVKRYLILFHCSSSTLWQKSVPISRIFKKDMTLAIHLKITDTSQTVLLFGIGGSRTICYDMGECKFVGPLDLLRRF